MTASQLPIDQPLGGPAPTTDIPNPEAGPTAESPEEEEKKKRRRRAFFLFFLLGLLVFLIGLIIWYLLFRQPIPIPLPIIPDSELPRYSTSFYGPDNPTGVAVTPSGDRIYVTDTGGDRVTYIFDGGGNQLGTMAPPDQVGGDHVPFYVAIDPMTEEVYISDRVTGIIYIYDRDGRYQREYALATPEVGWQPTALTFAEDGNLFVADWGVKGQRILEVDRTGVITRVIGADEGLTFPNGIALDDAGNTYVTDSNNGRLLVFDPDGKVTARVGRGANIGNLGLPRGLATDRRGRIFAVDSTGQSVMVYRVAADDQRRLDFLGSFGEPGIADGQFSYPMGGAVDDRGRVYVADTANGRVQVWSY